MLTGARPHLLSPNAHGQLSPACRGCSNPPGLPRGPSHTLAEASGGARRVLSPQLSPLGRWGEGRAGLGGVSPPPLAPAVLQGIPSGAAAPSGPAGRSGSPGWGRVLAAPWGRSVPPRAASSPAFPAGPAPARGCCRSWAGGVLETRPSAAREKIKGVARGAEWPCGSSGLETGLLARGCELGADGGTAVGVAARGDKLGTGCTAPCFLQPSVLAGWGQGQSCWGPPGTGSAPPCPRPCPQPRGALRLSRARRHGAGRDQV